MKVICQKGPIGYERKSNIMTQNDKKSSPSLMSFDSHVLIQCLYNRWNTSKLFCMETMDPNKFNVTRHYHHNNRSADNSQSVDEPINFMLNPHSIIGNETKNPPTCIELNANNTHPNELIEFQVKFIEQNRHRRFVPRIILIIRHDSINNIDYQQQQQQNNDSQSNHHMNSEDHGIEIEEQHKQQFIDFVRWNNQHDLNDSLRNSQNYYQYNKDDDDNKQQQQQRLKNHRWNEKEKILVTKFARLALSIQMSTTMDKIKDHKDCYFNDNIIIGNHLVNVTTEFLMFDCPINYGNNDVVDVDNSFNIHINIEPIHGSAKSLIESIKICGFQAFSIADEQCGQPLIPIYGLVTQIERSNTNLVAQYSCIQGYRIANMKNELKIGLNVDHNVNNNDYQLQYYADNGNNQLNNEEIDSLNGNNISSNDVTMERTCDRRTHKWTPDFNDVLCVPKYWCRNPPPMPDPTKFLFEYSKLDNLNRAIADSSMATLRCIMVTHNVMPFTIYRCGKSGEWIKVGKIANYTEPEPDCVPSKYRTGLPSPSSGGRYYRGYRRYYYRYYPPQSSSNMNTVLWGHKLTDNKYLTYYGGAGIAILFLASFIILIHVRRMAKKMSTQMREQTYMSMEKSNNDAFMSMVSDNQMDHTGNPPDYYSETNFFDANTMYSNDLPPPATPISMPVSGGGGGKSSKNDLSSNFDSIKF
nr:uncharacterized protein LOC124499367 [Dermatophagoides farinae]